MVEPLSAADGSAAGLVLARAFRDNPAMTAVLAGDPPEVRLRVLERAMIGFTEAVRRYGVAEIVRVEGRVAAVALSFPPGGYPPPIVAQLIGARGPIAAGLRRALRFARIDHEMRKRHPKYPHWYLWILGVEPECQGQGLGSELLRSLSARSLKMPCYLETDKATSVRLYEKHGYAVTSEETLPGVEVKLWFMKRPGETERDS